MAQFGPIYGTITSISPFQTGTARDEACTLLFSIMTQEMGPVTFTVTPDTYVEGQETLKTGDSVAAFYDTEAAVPLIYPPRYHAVLIAETDDGLFAAFDYFDENLVNTDRSLRLNLPEKDGPEILMANGQVYYGTAANHYLLVLYGPATYSIPAMTTPEKIIVFCDPN